MGWQKTYACQECSPDDYDDDTQDHASKLSCELYGRYVFMFLCVLSVSCTSYFDDVYYAASIPHEPCEIIFPHDSYDSYASNEF